MPYVILAWRGASKSIARPYLIASAVYLLMLFIMLPVRHLRYLLPLSLVVGWSVSGYLALFRRPLVRAFALVVLAAVTVLPSFFLVGALSKTLASGRPVLSTSSKVCGIEGVKRVVFKRDTRIHDKHHFIPIFEFGKSAGSPG